jgi:hypothetical protein
MRLHVEQSLFELLTQIQLHCFRRGIDSLAAGNTVLAAAHWLALSRPAPI